MYNDIFTQISRTPGNAIPVMAQKSLTGHAKGGSAAWQMIGLCQTVNSGIIPGNRNADNVDKELQQWEYLMFPSKSIHTDGIKAGLMVRTFVYRIANSIKNYIRLRSALGKLEALLLLFILVTCSRCLRQNNSRRTRN